MARQSGAGIMEELARLVESALFPGAESPAQAPAASGMPDFEVGCTLCKMVERRWQLGLPSTLTRLPGHAKSPSQRYSCSDLFGAT